MGRSRPDIHVTDRPHVGSAEKRPDCPGLPDAIGIADGDFHATLSSAGYDADTILLAELTPQIEVAWVDGRVSWRERELILDAATHRGVRPYSHAASLLARWLERRPHDRLLRISREAIQRMFRRLPAYLKAHVRRSLLRECRAVAQASGGVLGWRSVSSVEQDVIDSFASDLDWGDSQGGCAMSSECRSPRAVSVDHHRARGARDSPADQPAAH